MLEKTIKQVLTKKVNQWLKTIDDDNVVKAIKKDLIITGGCFTSMIMNEEPNDFDCYFRTKETTLKVAEYYTKVWNSANKSKQTGRGDFAKVMVLDGANPSNEILDFYRITSLKESKSRMIANCPPERIKMIFPSDGVIGDPKEVNSNEELGLKDPINTVEELDEIKADEALKKEEKKYHPVFISSNAITLSEGIQIVVRFYGEPETIHDTYDFEHTKAYYMYKTGTIEIPNSVYECTINKTLMYAGSKYPVCSIFRIRKFISRGWTINAGQLLKIAYQVSELDLNDIDVLEDQLVGVDSLYFMHLIEEFRKKSESDPNFKLDTNYVMSLVDKIF